MAKLKTNYTGGWDNLLCKMPLGDQPTASERIGYMDPMPQDTYWYGRPSPPDVHGGGVKHHEALQYLSDIAIYIVELSDMEVRYKLMFQRLIRAIAIMTRKSVDKNALG